jgi:hypothetical protein
MRVIAWFMPKVRLVKGASSRSIWLSGHHINHKACVGQLHNHLTREHPKTLQELYENFEKFSNLEVLHFWKLEQQRKTLKESEASKPTRYNKGRPSTKNYDSTLKQVNSIDSDGCRPSENWEKFFCPPQRDHRQWSFDTRKDVHNHYIACIMRMI